MYTFFGTKSRLLLGLCCLAFVWGCQPQVGPPPNPFDDIDRTDIKMDPPPPDSASMIGLHTYIFAKSCAVPGCHDGSFEPDYRTVQSTYSTLVYQPVIKNTPTGDYSYRVVPFDVEASWLYYRVTTEDQILGRMPLYDNPLTESQLKALRDWINAGAPDMFGDASYLPNTQPRATSLAAFNKLGGLDYRRDTARIDGISYYPFTASQSLDMDIWIGLEDDSTDLGQLQNARLLFSGDADNYAQATEITMTYSATAQVVPDYYGPNQPGFFHWKATIPGGMNLPTDNNGITFFRIKVNDGDHVEDYEIPRNNHSFELKLFLSFVRV
ncbi:MAG: hypothetical protein AAFR61_32165 [Bacteroidota bacterium]